MQLKNKVAIVTGGSQGIGEAICNASARERLLFRIPTHTVYMQAENISGAAVFLASDAARAVHGLDLIVDNGISSAQI